jgi:hypothetical protein
MARRKFHWRISFWVLGTVGILFAIPLWHFSARCPVVPAGGSENRADASSSCRSSGFLPSGVSGFVSIAPSGSTLSTRGCRLVAR